SDGHQAAERPRHRPGLRLQRMVVGRHSARTTRALSHRHRYAARLRRRITAERHGRHRAQKSQQTDALRVLPPELLSFEVMGPGGMASCDPQPDTRAPDRLAFLRLAPGQSMTITSRLV